MRTSSVLKIVSLAAALAMVAAVPGASAKVAHKITKRPPDSCILHRHVVAAGTVCSYDCDPKSLWCSQQVCSGGHFYPVISCQSIFCTRKCG